MRRGIDLARVKVLVVVESALGTRGNKSKSKMCTQQRQSQNVHHHILNGGFLLMLHNESTIAMTKNDDSACIANDHSA